jgi:predicted exporter
VAEDYGIHYFAARQGRPWARPRSVMRSLLPGLVLALATSVIAYLALGLTPFPGLRQMAVFSAAGLTGAFFTAVCWFPLLDRGRPADSKLAAAIRASLARWPRWRPGRGTLAATAAIALVCIAGMLQLRVSDQLRDWQGSPAAMLHAQREASGLLGTASVAQFYLVRGTSTQEVLEREEALKRELDPLVRLGTLAGYSAVSDWVPSLRRQREDARLTERVERQVLAGVNAALGENIVRPARPSGDLTVESWLAHAASAPARHLWLGQVEGEYTTVVLLNGLNDAALLPRLASAGAAVTGVRWIDRASEVSGLLGRYRGAMTALLLAGHLAVFAALWGRFRNAAWRAWLPTAAASALTVGILGWLGEPFQLANYGIFLLEHQGDGSAWLAVVLGAASTWLAFGLLALSSTPALRAFGLTLLIGIGLVWAASPWMRLPSPGAVDVEPAP